MNPRPLAHSRTLAILTAFVAHLFGAQTSAAQIAPNKHVGILYENWFNRYTNTNYVHPTPACGLTPPAGCVPTAQMPVSPAYKWWGQPQLGFYTSSNTTVIDTHASWLVDASVDFVLLDVTNSNVRHSDLWSGVAALLSRYTARYASGTPTPKVAFITSSRKPIGAAHNDIEELWLQAFSNPSYNPNIFLKWGTKPLLLARDGAPNDPQPGCGATLFNNPLSHYFECKPSEGMTGSANYWSFIDNHPQPLFMSQGWPEAISVSAAQNQPYMNISTARGRNWNRHTGQNNGSQGQNFDDQWARARDQNPSAVILNSWNEWVAHRTYSSYSCGNDCYIDESSPEFSNDLEPMAGGSGTYYYQRLKANAKAFKRNSPDLFFYERNAGLWHIKEGRGAAELAASNFAHNFYWPSGSNYQPIVGDFNDDGRTDIGVRDKNSGIWYFAFSNGNGTYSNTRNFNWPSPSTFIPLVGDFNDDGLTDIALWDPNSGTFYFAFSDGNGGYANTRNFVWPAPSNYVPLVGDFNNDNKTDLALWGPSTGTWHFAFFDGVSFYNNSRNFQWAVGGHYQPFVGDFDCDNKTDIALRDSNTGKIHLANFDGVSSYANSFGNNYKWGTGSNFLILTQPDVCNGQL